MTDAPRFLVLDADTANQEDLYSVVNSHLLSQEAVHETFLEAVSAHELKYPTGLDFGHCQVAIPHIDPEHIITPGVLVCRNAQPTPFHAMDDPERTLDVRLTIWPLVTDPQNQTGMLGAVIALLQEETSYQRLLTESPEKLEELLAGVLAAIGSED